MESLGIRKLVKTLKQLNRDVHICYEADTYPTMIIVRCNDLAQMKFPEGYYYTEKGMLTNKHNTESGEYECFGLITEYEYLCRFV